MLRVGRCLYIVFEIFSIEVADKQTRRLTIKVVRSSDILLYKVYV